LESHWNIPLLALARRQLKTLTTADSLHLISQKMVFETELEEFMSGIAQLVVFPRGYNTETGQKVDNNDDADATMSLTSREEDLNHPSPDNVSLSQSDTTESGTVEDVNGGRKRDDGRTEHVTMAVEETGHNPKLTQDDQPQENHDHDHHRHHQHHPRHPHYSLHSHANGKNPLESAWFKGHFVDLKTRKVCCYSY
jgi:hypothetical protein